MLSRSEVLEYFDRYTFNVGLDGCRDLNDCYKRCSETKYDIWATVKAEMDMVNGKHLSVITYNPFAFTCGFIYTDNTHETKRIRFRVYTPSHTCDIELGPNELIELKRQGISYE